jgi:hypothetical protein
LFLKEKIYRIVIRDRFSGSSFPVGSAEAEASQMELVERRFEEQHGGTGVAGEADRLGRSTYNKIKTTVRIKL